MHHFLDNYLIGLKTVFQSPSPTHIGTNCSIVILLHSLHEIIVSKHHATLTSLISPPSNFPMNHKNQPVVLSLGETILKTDQIVIHVGSEQCTSNTLPWKCGKWQLDTHLPCDGPLGYVISVSQQFALSTQYLYRTAAWLRYARLVDYNATAKMFCIMGIFKHMICSMFCQR